MAPLKQDILMNKKTIASRYLPALFIVVSSLLNGCSSPKPVARPQQDSTLYIAEYVPEKNLFDNVNRGNLPRVMMIVDEKALGTIPTAEVEAMAQQILTENNIPVVDQDMVRADQQRQKKLLKMAGDNRGAASAGLQFGADITVVGDAVVKPSARRIAESNLRNYQAVVTLRAIRTDNAAVLSSASETVSIIALDDVSGSSKALKKAAEKTLEKLLPRSVCQWQENGGQTSRFEHHIVLTVGGTDQIWKVKALRDRLRNDKRTFSNVVQKSYTAGVVIFEMDSALPSEEAAEEMVINPPEGLKMQVLSIEAGNIDLKAVNS
jgi:hypothetical protein